MYKLTQSKKIKKFVFCLIISTISCMNISVKAMMNDEETIKTTLKTITKCPNFGSQRIHCQVVNNRGGGLLCDYHDDVRINELKDKLAKIQQKKTLPAPIPTEEPKKNDNQ